MSIKLEWEDMECNFSSVQRAKVFGGWIVKSIQDVLVSLHQDQMPGAGYEWRESMVFVPDVNHEWGNEEEEVMREGDKDPTVPYEFKVPECCYCHSESVSCLFVNNKPIPAKCDTCGNILFTYPVKD